MSTPSSIGSSSQSSDLFSTSFSIEALCDEANKGKRHKMLFFWGHTERDSTRTTAACFSQWYPSPFEVDNLTYATCEHWMMAKKAELMGDEKTRSLILDASSPGAAKALGRKVAHFDDDKWLSKRISIVIEGNLHKFLSTKT